MIPGPIEMPIWDVAWNTTVFKWFIISQKSDLSKASKECYALIT